MKVSPSLSLCVETLGAMHGAMSFARPLLDHLFGDAGGEVVMGTCRRLLRDETNMKGWASDLCSVKLRGTARHINAHVFFTRWLYVTDLRLNPAWRMLEFFYSPQYYSGAEAFYDDLSDRTGLADLRTQLTEFGEADRLQVLMAAVDASEKLLIDKPLDDLDHWICDTILRLDFVCDGTARLYSGYIDLLKHETIETILDKIGDSKVRSEIETEIANMEAI